MLIFDEIKIPSKENRKCKCLDLGVYLVLSGRARRQCCYSSVGKEIMLELENLSKSSDVPIRTLHVLSLR